MSANLSLSLRERCLNAPKADSDGEGILNQTNFNSKLSLFAIKTAIYQLVGVGVPNDPPLPTKTNFIFSREDNILPYGYAQPK